MIKPRVLIATSHLLCALLATACSGENGPNGVKGVNGRDGGAGKDGVNGEAGKQGPPGRDGANGKDGVPGKDGLPGKDGVNGEAGKQDPPGKDGRGESRSDGGVDAGASDRPPNILFIMADDLGYSDIHAFGGEIDTPNLDALIADGRILTNHHAGTVSAITRSMLISGTDHHLVGEGTMGAPTDERKGLPGYEGYLNDSSLSVAELLKDAGYHTYIAGKWHLGSAIAGATGAGKTPDQWGFERSFSLLGGAASNHFTHEAAGSKNFVLDGAYAQPGQPGQKSGFSTNLYTDTLIEFIDGNHGDGKPFFAYAAYTSPHWPLQVPEPWLSKYKGRYDQGYDAVRAARIQRQRDSGLVPESWTPFPGAPETLVQSPATANYGTASGKSISAVHFPDDGYVDYHAGFVDKKWTSLTDLERKPRRATWRCTPAWCRTSTGTSGG